MTVTDLKRAMKEKDLVEIKLNDELSFNIDVNLNYEELRAWTVALKPIARKLDHAEFLAYVHGIMIELFTDIPMPKKNGEIDRDLLMEFSLKFNILSTIMSTLQAKNSMAGQTTLEILNSTLTPEKTEAEVLDETLGGIKRFLDGLKSEDITNAIKEQFINKK